MTFSICSSDQAYCFEFYLTWPCLSGKAVRQKNLKFTSRKTYVTKLTFLELIWRVDNFNFRKILLCSSSWYSIKLVLGGLIWIFIPFLMFASNIRRARVQVHFGRNPSFFTFAFWQNLEGAKYKNYLSKLNKFYVGGKPVAFVIHPFCLA